MNHCKANKKYRFQKKKKSILLTIFVLVDTQASKHKPDSVVLNLNYRPLCLGYMYLWYDQNYY